MGGSLSTECGACGCSRVESDDSHSAGNVAPEWSAETRTLADSNVSQNHPDETIDIVTINSSLELSKVANVATLVAQQQAEDAAAAQEADDAAKAAAEKEADEAEEAKKEADEKQAALAKAEAETEAAKQSGDAEQAQRAEEAMKVAQQEAREAAAVAKREADEALAAQKVACARSRGSCSAHLYVSMEHSMPLNFTSP